MALFIGVLLYMIYLIIQNAVDLFGEPMTEVVESYSGGNVGDAT